MEVQSRYRMPAEWEPHEGTWIAWPHERTDWPGKFEPVPWVYGEFVRRVAQVERVHILVNTEEAREEARGVLADAGASLAAVDFFVCPTDRSWTRDFCPIWVRDVRSNEPVLLNWQFNGWAKYDNWATDDAVPAAIAARDGSHIIEPMFRGRRIVLEGGSIDVNGQGTLLTTEECLLSDVQARNPGLSRADLESVFAEYLGIRNTLWLRNGIHGDDTHGHIDDLARFTDPHTITVVSEDDPASPNYELLRDNLALLREMRDQDGEPLRVVKLPMPDPVEFAGQPLPASYANFYVANGLVLVPTFNDPKDRVALNTLAELFPRHRVSGIHAVDLVLGLGTLHCMTQQQVVD